MEMAADVTEENRSIKFTSKYKEYNIENVDWKVYLDVTITNNGKEGEEIDKRILLDH